MSHVCTHVDMHFQFEDFAKHFSHVGIHVDMYFQPDVFLFTSVFFSFGKLPFSVLCHVNECDGC